MPGMKAIQARWYRKGRIAPVRLIVIHSMESPEGPSTAENVANYFKTTGTQASAHVCVDNNSAVRCVADADTAWAAPGGNADGLQLELAGYARQMRSQWLDDYSRDMLHQAAIVVAAWCKKYSIPARRLTRTQLKAGLKGITSHVDISAVYKQSDHYDPGPNFPWDHLLAEVQTLLGAEKPPPVDAPEAPAWPGRLFQVKSPPMVGKDIATWQRQMKSRGWNIKVDSAYAADDAAVARAFQEEKDLDVDGLVGPDTWRAAWSEPIT